MVNFAGCDKSLPGMLMAAARIDVATVAVERGDVVNALSLSGTVSRDAAFPVRSSTDGRAGSVLAFGVLVPMLGIGLNGWWASRDGAFPPRTEGK